MKVNYTRNVGITEGPAPDRDKMSLLWPRTLTHCKIQSNKLSVHSPLNDASTAAAFKLAAPSTGEWSKSSLFRNLLVGELDHYVPSVNVNNGQGSDRRPRTVGQLSSHQDNHIL